MHFTNFSLSPAVQFSKWKMMMLRSNAVLSVKFTLNEMKAVPK